MIKEYIVIERYK